MKQLKDLAHKSRDNPQDRLACYVELLEAHIKTQNEMIETFQQELALLSIELTQEKSRNSNLQPFCTLENTHGKKTGNTKYFMRGFQTMTHCPMFVNKRSRSKCQTTTTHAHNRFPRLKRKS